MMQAAPLCPERSLWEPSQQSRHFHLTEGATYTPGLNEFNIGTTYATSDFKHEGNIPGIEPSVTLPSVV